MPNNLRNHRPWLRFIVEPDSSDNAGSPAVGAPGADPAPSSEDHSGEDSGTDPPSGGEDAGDGSDGDDAGEDGTADLLAKITAERDALQEKIAAHEREQMTEQEKIAADRDSAVKRAEDAEAKVAALNREKLVAEAAAAAKLPPAMADRLRGETKEELAADAKAMAESLGFDRSAVDPSQGKGSSGPMTHHSLADALSAHYGTGTSR